MKDPEVILPTRKPIAYAVYPKGDYRTDSPLTCRPGTWIRVDEDVPIFAGPNGGGMTLS